MILRLTSDYTNSHIREYSQKFVLIRVSNRQHLFYPLHVLLDRSFHYILERLGSQRASMASAGQSYLHNAFFLVCFHQFNISAIEIYGGAN
jgi:hypothetical protein